MHWHEIWRYLLVIFACAVFMAIVLWVALAL